MIYEVVYLVKIFQKSFVCFRGLLSQKPCLFSLFAYVAKSKFICISLKSTCVFSKNVNVFFSYFLGSEELIHLLKTNIKWDPS